MEWLIAWTRVLSCSCITCSGTVMLCQRQECCRSLAKPYVGSEHVFWFVYGSYWCLQESVPCKSSWHSHLSEVQHSTIPKATGDDPRAVRPCRVCPTSARPLRCVDGRGTVARVPCQSGAEIDPVWHHGIYISEYNIFPNISQALVHCNRQISLVPVVVYRLFSCVLQFAM